MKQMSKIYFLKGLPASGKSTWAERLVKKDSSFVRINKDSIRKMLCGEPFNNKLKENMVLAIRDHVLKEALNRGKNVIVDDTNFNPKHLETITKIAKEFNAEVEVKQFDISVEEAIKRDLKRENSVGEKVIRDMFEQYLRPPVTYFNDEQNPDAIIVDIDGTLAKMSGRSPFEWNRVDEDELNYPVFHSIQGMKEFDCQIIFMSGRDSCARKKTVKWIKDKTEWEENKDYLLYMRPEGDFRSDYTVKKELFDKYIAGRYYIWCVYDDRNQVVRLWRKHFGLPCFQVDYGDF